MRKKALIRRGVLFIALLSLILPVARQSGRAQTNAIQLAVDTAVQNQDGLLTIYNTTRMAGERGFPIGVGDINGDGKADIAMGGMYASAGPGSRINNGEIKVYLSDGRDSGDVDLAQNPANVYSILGANSGDVLGTSVAVNGDVNGDGVKDIALGAFCDDGPSNSRFNCGAAYIVYGSRNYNKNYDLATADGNPPAGVVAIYGAQISARAGVWIDQGDIDGDGFADIVIGADQINSDGRQHLGGAYIVFGTANLPSVIDLAAPPAGVRTATIIGADPEDHWGAALQVGDVNNDGIGDVIIGGSIFRDSGSFVDVNNDSGHNARGADFGGSRPLCGEVYVIYGSRNWVATIDLKNPPATATHIIGAQQRDLLGSQVHSADLNGDGRTDLIVGALQAQAPDVRGNTGAVYVIYGATNIVGATIDLSLPDASGLRVTKIYGENAGDCAGDSVRAFDINNDGMAELFVGSPEHTFTINGVTRDDTGDTIVIYGQRDFLPSEIKFYDPPAAPKLYMLAGSNSFDGGDEFSYRLWGGDVDGDGYIDYVANAMHGDGFNDTLVNAGQVHIFSGRKLSAKLGLLQPPPVDTQPPVLTSASLQSNNQTVAESPAGQSGLQIRVVGTGFKADTEVLINGVRVNARTPNEAPTTQRLVLLDENPTIRNTAGTLTVRTRHTSPVSNLSNEVIAGRLIGPEISSVKIKVKGTNKLLVKINGANFASDATIQITANGQNVNIAAIAFNASDSMQATIKGSAAPPSGTTIRVRVVNPPGIQSNEITATRP